MKRFPDKNRQKELSTKSAFGKNLTNTPVEESGVSFSFRFFKQTENFGISGKTDVWMSGLLEQLRLVSGKSADELVTDLNLKEGLRMHPLDLYSGKTALSEKDFDNIPKRFQPNAQDCPIMQFQISKANGRVIGFFNENHSVFYIVYLDPNHNAQLSKFSGYKIREIKPCLSEIDDLMAKIAKHACLETALAEDAAEFLYTNNKAYFCFDKELVEPLYEMLECKDFQSKLEEFLLSKL